MQYIPDCPADKISSISDTDHIYNGSGADTFPDCKEDNDQNKDIHNQLPGAECHLDKSADPEIHARKGIHSKPAQPVASDTDADKQDAKKHHNCSFHQEAAFFVHAVFPPLTAFRI